MGVFISDLDPFCLTFGFKRLALLELCVHWQPSLLCNTLIVLLNRFHAFLSLSYVPHSEVEALANSFILRSHSPALRRPFGLYSDCMTWHSEDH